jgi:cytochrome b pre-mRNA-processing protein 3
MPFKRFQDRRRREQAANALYLSLVAQARQPAFYAALGVPDSPEGRYDMVVLHAYLLMRRIGVVGGEAAKELSQSTFDLMFADMDQSLREMGVGDTGVGKRVRRMAENFYGRVAAYDKAQEEGGDALERALARNLYQTVTPVPVHLVAMAAYLLAQQRHLAGQDDATLMAGAITFGPVEEATS